MEMRNKFFSIVELDPGEFRLYTEMQSFQLTPELLDHLSGAALSAKEYFYE